MNKKHIYVLTYQSKHRKTYDTLCRLRALGYQNITVYATPFTYKKVYKPLLNHRPIDTDMSTKEVCTSFGYEYIDVDGYSDIDVEKESIFLVCGAGILPSDFIERNIVINAHPGYIPEVRGLDSFKWALYEHKTIGVSSHIIGNEVDAGYVINREIIEIEEGDTFFSLAEKVYQREIAMLVSSIKQLDGNLEYYEGEGIVHKRMPNNIEEELKLKVFNLK